MRKNYSTTGIVGYADDTPFNSSLAYLERLERRWEDADDAKIEGNMIQYFRTLHTLYMNTHPFFDEEERTKCEKMSTDIELSIDEINKKMNPSDASLFITDLEKSLDKLRMQLVKLLFKYQITYYQRNITTWQEQVKDDYQ